MIRLYMCFNVFSRNSVRLAAFFSLVLTHAMLYVKWVANTILTTGTHCTTRGLRRGGGAAVAAAAEENAKLRRCTALSAIARKKSRKQ